MATINFYLDRPDRKNECPVFIVYQMKGKKFKFFTKEKVAPKAWDAINQRVKRNYSGESEINRNLEVQKDIIKKIERDAAYAQVPLTVEHVQERYINLLGKSTSGNEFFPMFENYLESSATTKTIPTVRGYKATLNRLREFESYSNDKLSFENINSEFYERFQSYLVNDLKQLNNTVGKHFKTIKAFMNYATEKGRNKNMAFKKFKVVKEEVNLISLTNEELLRLYKLDLTSIAQSKVRDNFCFACFTGLRFSDSSRLREEHIEQDFISIRTEKTRDFLKIPLNSFAKEILRKHGGKIPESISNQKTNEHLKTLGKLAEINDPVSITQYSGSNKLVKTVPKFELLSTHTARRTFVTLALEKGIRPELVMEMTGHKDYSSFKKYIKITDKVKLVEMNRLWNNQELLKAI